MNLSLFLIIGFAWISNAYRVEFDNGLNLLKLESNKLVNGKRVEEPKAEEAINMLSALGYKVTRFKQNQEEGQKIAEELKALKSNQENLSIKSRRPLETIFKELTNQKETYQKSSEDEYSGSANNVEAKKANMENAGAYQKNEQETGKTMKNNEKKNSISKHRIQLDSAKYGSFDIFITNLNENVNNNNGTKTETYDR